MAILTSSWNYDITAILIGASTIAYYYLTYTYDYWKKRNVPYERPVLFFGNFFDAIFLRKNIAEYFASYYQKTKERYFGLYVFRRPFLVLRDPELIKAVLVKDFAHFTPRGNSVVKNDPIGQYNIFTLKNSVQWKYLRTKLTPAFSSGKIKQMFVLMVEVGEQLNAYLKDHVPESSTLEMKECCAKYTTDVISSCAFGIQSNSLIDETAKFRLFGRMMFEYTFWRGLETVAFMFSSFLTRVLRLKLLGKEATLFFRQIFENVMQERENSNIQRPDIIDALIKLKSTGSIEDNGGTNYALDVNPTLKFEGDLLVAQAVIFFAAGFETTSTAMSITMHFLSCNEDVQNKLRKEILSTLVKHDGKVTYESVNEMKYLDMCIKESLRNYPSLGFLDRECEKPYKIPGSDIVLDKGVVVVIPLYGLQKDPKYFPNPDKYDPERFSDENKNNIVPGTYMPFGDGPRNCIGERFGYFSAKIGLIHMLKDFEIITTEKKELKLNPKAYPTASIGGINVQFKKGRSLSEYD